MGYNVLSGSVSNLYDIKASGSFTGSFGGDGTNLENVTQFDLYGQTTAGAIPYYKSVSGETHLEGDSTFTFNSKASSGINLSGILAGTATTSSFLALDSNGNIVLTSSAAGGSGGSDDDFSASGNGIGSSGVFFARTVVNSTQVISKTSYYIGVSASSNITLTLPLANMTSVGQTFVFKDEIGSAGTYDIFIATAMNNTIDGITSVKLESPFGAVNIYSNGADKYFMY
jgi:hypothetical protein